ncbi:MAG: thioredoxin family protein [Leptospira sp.]|nr:thioredoxin family protein [Leptospira sp.]
MKVFFVRTILVIFLAITTLPIYSESHTFKGKHSSIEFIQLTSSTGSTLALKIIPNDGWHVYWINPGDSGSSLIVDWEKLPNAYDGKWSWPTPERIDTGGIINFGYHKEAILISKGNPSSKLKGERISAEFQWMACKNECVPESAYLTAKNYSPKDRLFDSLSREIEVQLEKSHPQKMPSDWIASFQEKKDRFQFYLDTKETFPNKVPNIDFFPVHGEILSSQKPTFRQISSQSWEIGVLKSEYYSNDETELMEAVVSLGDKSFLITFQKENSYYFFQAILFAFLGGLLLNLMPCVFPILTMKAMSVVQSSSMLASDKRKDSLFYGLGVISFFWLLYLVFLALKIGGSNLGWGFQLQNPSFVFLLVLLFVFMGLQMLGWNEFSVGVSGKFANMTEKKGFWGSYFSGAIAVIVATPCTAPFMGTALAYAFSESAVVGLVVFSSLGVGMALPIILIQNSRFVAKLIPKPGNWMITFKEFLSFPLFLTAIWLLWVLSAIVDRNELFFSMGGLVVLIMLVWWFKKVKKPVFKTLLLSLILAGIIGLGLSFTQLGNQAKLQSNHDAGSSQKFTEQKFGFNNPVTYSKENLAALLETDSPIFFYFTADWCVTCKYNEKTVFKREDVEEYFQNNKIIVLKADWTNEDDAITEALESFGRNGVPLYVFYPPGNRNSPKILPQMLTKNLLETEINL